LSAFENESICGPDDRQHVEDYDGSLGVTREYVDSVQGAVGQLVQCGSIGCSVDGGQRFCSGAIVGVHPETGNDVFISAGHCDGTSLEELQITFNYQRGTDGKKRKETRVAVLRVLESVSPDTEDIDYVLYELDGNPGEVFGYIPPAVRDAQVGEMLCIIQHPGGEMKQIEAGECIEIAGTRIRYNDIDTMGGSSGSPVINSEGRLVGVHTNGGCSTSGGGFNFGTRLEAILEVSPLLFELWDEADNA
jgi:V8-like Glu-specific endopeptidase